MLLEIAVADAWGAQFEYEPPHICRPDNDKLLKESELPSSFRLNNKWPLLGAGRYTDDTQRALGLAEHIIEDSEWTDLAIANRFFQVFERDPRTGYGRFTYEVLSSVNSGEEFLQAFTQSRLQGSTNGSSMGVAPVGYYPTITEVRQKAIQQSQITHAHQNSLVATQATALMSHYFIYDLGPKELLAEFLNEHLGAHWNWSTPWQGPVLKSDAMDTVRAALTALVEENSLTKAIHKAVDYTGDTDTVAAIVAGIGSMVKEIQQDLPQQIIGALENNMFGADYLRVIDKKLQEKFIT